MQQQKNDKLDASNQFKLYIFKNWVNGKTKLHPIPSW